MTTTVYFASGDYRKARELALSHVLVVEFETTEGPEAGGFEEYEYTYNPVDGRWYEVNDSTSAITRIAVMA